MVIVWAGFSYKIIQERCFIEGLQARLYKGISPLTLFYFFINLFFDPLPTVCPTELAVTLIIELLSYNVTTWSWFQQFTMPMLNAIGQSFYPKLKYLPKAKS